MKIRTGLALGAAAAVLVVTVPLTAKLLGVFDGLPWETERTERSEPSVLNSLEDLADFHAARGNYQVAVTIEEDSPVAPSFLAGEQSTLLAQGSVDAVVDFSTLDDDAIRIGPDGEVTVTVPEPELVDAQVNPEHSEVMSHERGLLDRVTSMFSDNEISERDLYVLAGDELNEAASESELQDRAQANTTDMLEGMLGELGYKDVTVQFAGTPVTP
jgi:hypothetical protein